MHYVSYDPPVLDDVDGETVWGRSDQGFCRFAVQKARVDIDQETGFSLHLRDRIQVRSQRNPSVSVASSADEEPVAVPRCEIARMSQQRVGICDRDHVFQISSATVIALESTLRPGDRDRGKFRARLEDDDLVQHLKSNVFGGKSFIRLILFLVLGDTMKAFRAIGSFKISSRGWQKFNVEIAAEDEKAATERVMSNLGSHHRVGRRDIRMNEVTPISLESVTDPVVRHLIGGQ